MHPNLKLLSNSACSTLHGCPRRFELDRMLGGDEEGDVHTNFGHVVGLGVQEMLTHGDYPRTVWEMFKQWRGDDFDPEDGIRIKKTFWWAMEAVARFQRLRNNIFGNMDIATLNGRPATELGFKIDCGDGFYYRGFIDAVLINRMKKQLVVLECKTTKFNKLDEAQWYHSGQALGYSLILDTVIAQEGIEETSSYEVYYPVYKSSEADWECFKFLKNHTRRALWIKNILLDKKHVIEYFNEEYFPLHGEFCYNFFKQCPHFGRCEFDNKLLFNPANVPVKEEARHKFDFHFSLEEIVEQQLLKGA